MYGESTQSLTTICIIEDVEEIRTELASFLDSQTGFSCRQHYSSMEEFFDHRNKVPLPDVILMDIGLPGISGITGMELIKRDEPEIDIIMLTVYDDHNKIFQALCAGASGYLLKSTSFEGITASIRECRNGGAPMSPQIGRKVLEFFNKKDKPVEKTTLTKREMEIVAGIVDGLSYKMIAAHSGVSIDTVRFHIKNIYKKLQVNSRSEVVAKSLKGEL